jgi:hypothetical protein
MITREDIIQVYQNREERLLEWMENNPEKKSITQLKKDLRLWDKEISESQKLAKENDPYFTTESLGTAYTFMNTASAIYANYVVGLYYIKKLEKELKQKSKKKPKDSKFNA